MKLHLLLITALLISISSCTEEPTPPPVREPEFLPFVSVEDCVPHEASPCYLSTDSVNIRIRNYGRYELCNIEYTAFADTINFGSLMPGDSTCFVADHKNYRYPHIIRYDVGDTSIQRKSLDFVGEDLLKPGNYNYNIADITNDQVITTHSRLTREDLEIPIPNDPLEGCVEHTKTDCGIDESRLNLRVINHSIFDLCNVSYQSYFGDTLNFGNLLAREISCYVPIDSINRFYGISSAGLSELSLKAGRIPAIPSTSGIVSEGNYTLHISVTRLNEEGLRTLVLEDE